MKPQQVDEELVAVDGEVHLPVDEREPRAELGQGLLQPAQSAQAQSLVPGPSGQGEEVEDLRILDNLLRSITVDRLEVIGEVGRRGAHPTVQAGGDVVLQHLPRPAQAPRFRLTG